VLSLTLFYVYVDCLIQTVQKSELGCWLGDVNFGFILYGDDVVLISASVCELKKMVDLCTNKFTSIDMFVNAKKCHGIRFDCRIMYMYLSQCTE